MFVRDGDHKTVAKMVMFIPETFKEMLVRYLGYSEEMAAYLVGLMTCSHCLEHLNVHWWRFLTCTYNKVMACRYCYSGIRRKRKKNKKV